MPKSVTRRSSVNVGDVPRPILVPDSGTAARQFWVNVGPKFGTGRAQGLDGAVPDLGPGSSRCWDVFVPGHGTAIGQGPSPRLVKIWYAICHTAVRTCFSAFSDEAPSLNHPVSLLFSDEASGFSMPSFRESEDTKSCGKRCHENFVIFGAEFGARYIAP